MRFIFTLSFTLIFYFGYTQSYFRAKIFANSQELNELSKQGVAVDHGNIKKDFFIISDFSEQELEIAKHLGLNYEIIIDDVVNYYEHQNDHNTRSANRNVCSGYSYITPTNFSYGSMAGYFTYQEFLNHLDSMASKFPTLISNKQPVGTFKTHENRDLLWVRISDNPAIDENEPEVFYSAIHHAREVASLSQLVYYMWYLLENYGKDSSITHLINHTEMYFIPVINPDGYIQNVTTNPNGGGMWRKNKRDNGGGIYGVDLNRNYGYQWGGLGASTSPSNDTYRGPSAFSEPETQAIKWFCEQHQFVTALNAHTYSNLLLYPYGYANNMPTVDDNLFKAFSEIMVQENGYDDIISSELYPASGDSDDWFYGEQSSKPKIFAMTPEIGSSFWPSQSDIITLANENIFMNIMNAKFAGRYAQISDKSNTFWTNLNSQFYYDIERLGLAGNGDFTVSIVPISSNIASVGSSDVYSGMAMLQQYNDSISVTLSPSISMGDKVVFGIQVNNGLYTEIDTIEKIYGLGNLIFSNNGSSTSGWSTNANWASTTSDYYSSPSSITDSPLGNYSNNTNTHIFTQNPISVPNGSAAFLNFWMKCDIEAGWDYAQVELSNDGITWTPLCGKYTKTGNGNQATGEPLYDGTFGWVQESIDISSYVGSNILIRFTLISDGGVVGDGFYFDDLEVRVIPFASSSINEVATPNITVYPNPVSDLLTVKSSVLKGSKLNMVDVTGKLMYSSNSQQDQVMIPVSNFDAGVYLLQIINQGNLYTKEIVISK